VFDDAGVDTQAYNNVALLILLKSLFMDLKLCGKFLSPNGTDCSARLQPSFRSGEAVHSRTIMSRAGAEGR